MRKFFVVTLVLIAVLVLVTVVTAEDAPACNGLMKALENIPPDSPGYTKAMEKAQVDCGQALDYAALLDLYESTDGENWDPYNWTNDIAAGLDHCSWQGVICDPSTSRVIELQLTYNQLIGPIPESFGNLSSLDYLDLGYNQLTSLPESFGNLSSLYYLVLRYNQLTSLPESFGNLSSLYRLTLYNNQLTSLPESFGNLSSLYTLALGENQLTSLPESFGNLSSLDTLELSGNQLTRIPNSFGNLSGLSLLYLYNNPLVCWELEAHNWAIPSGPPTVIGASTWDICPS